MQEKWELKTYCEVLGVSENSPQHEIHKAYIKAKKLYSRENPDLHNLFSSTEAEALDQLVEEAFAVLGSHSMRAFYQRKLDAQENQIKKPQTAFQDKTPVVETPEGHGRTIFGYYLVNQEIEADLRRAQVFDGQMLRTIRDYKDITISQLSTATKIKSTYIEAIEANNFNMLPASVYTRGFIIQIAKVLDLPSEEVASSYMCHYKSTHEHRV